MVWEGEIGNQESKNNCLLYHRSHDYCTANSGPKKVSQFDFVKKKKEKEKKTVQTGNV